MEAQLRLPNGIVLKVEGDTQKELFMEIASANEVFGEPCCGLCKSQDIKIVLRVAGEHDFPEYHCQKCYARLSLGQNLKGGGLFPIRKLIKNLDPNGDAGPEHGKPCRERGTWGQHNGWTHYKGEPKKEGKEEPPEKPTRGKR